MKRLASIGSWKRLCGQVGLLAGLGLSFVGTHDQPARAGAACPSETECSFKKPNLMIVLDYSSSMNIDFMGQTRWQAAVAAVKGIVTAQNGYFDDNMHLALLRFGHDPDPAVPGTQIPMTNFVDGVSLDVAWYDTFDGPDYPYFACNGQAIVDFLDQVEPPLCQNGNPCAGIGTWTAGGLALAQNTILESQADHPADLDPTKPRYYANLLVTDGVWTEQDGLGMDPVDDPAIVAGDMLVNQGAQTYVVAFGDAMGVAFADEIAMAGNTGAAFEADSPQALFDAIQSVLQTVIDDVVAPACTAGLPRVMILLDASSSMLNVDGVMRVTTHWDQARAAIASGNDALFDAPIASADGHPLEDVAHVGLSVFGHEDEEAVLVQYGPCMQDNVSWALDPNTSCALPGCTDPWGDPPIEWTFVDGSLVDPPGFDQPTVSHVPDCQQGGAQGQCTGSGTHTHLGLELVATNQQAYAMDPPYPADASTQYINILVTDGDYAGDSTDAQVSSALIAMYDAGITTYVIGLGFGMIGQTIDNMACWGSGGSGVPMCAGGTTPGFDALDQPALEGALAAIVEQLSFDPCCNFNDCSVAPEPSTNEPDPVPPPTTGEPNDGGSSTDTSAGSSGSTATSGMSADGSSGGATTGVDESGTSGGVTTAATSGESTVSGSSVSATGTSVTGAATNTTFPGSDGSGSDDGSQDTTGVTDRGCGCRADATPRSIAGALFAFVLFGATRRRRI